MPGNPQLRTGLPLLKTAAAPGRAARTISVTVERSEPRAVVHPLGHADDPHAIIGNDGLRLLRLAGRARCPRSRREVP